MKIDRYIYFEIFFCQIGYLGSGSYATVKKAIYKNQDVVAVKIFDRIYDKKTESDYLQEARQLKAINHPNIVRLLDMGRWNDGKDTFNCMIIEFADLGTLHHGKYTQLIGLSLK